MDYLLMMLNANEVTPFGHIIYLPNVLSLDLKPTLILLN